MKKSKLFLISVLLLATVFTLSISSLGTLAQEATANPTVTLVTSGGQSSFTFKSNSGELFENFNGVMPGDALTQPFTVESAPGNNGNFRIYMYAVEDENEATPKFLNAMSLKVLDGTNELTVLNANKSNTFGVLLGTFNPGNKKDLTVSLKVPIEMGDTFQGAGSIVKWYFYAEQVFDVVIYDNPPAPILSPSPSTSPTPTPTEIPEDDTPKDDLPVIDIPDDGTPTGNKPVDIGDIPQTGDESHPLVWVLLMIGSGSALTCLLVFGRKGTSKK